MILEQNCKYLYDCPKIQWIKNMVDLPRIELGAESLTLVVCSRPRSNFFRAETERMNRLATASQSLGNSERKNTPCFLDLAGVKFLLKKERVFFFLEFCLLSIQASGGTMRTKFCKNYFLGKWFAKTSAHLFLNYDVANGKGGWESVWHFCKAGLSEGEGGGDAAFSSRKISVTWGGIFHLLLFLFGGNWGKSYLHMCDLTIFICRSNI